MSLYRRRPNRRYCNGCLQTSQLRHLDIVSQLQRLEAVVAVATLWGIVSQLQRLPPNVAIATLCLSVDIVTLFYKRRYSDGFGRDGKKLGKFPTFGQKRRNQVSEFLPNVVVIIRRSRFVLIRRLSLSSVLTTLDLWLNTRLVHELYLKSMEGHF